MKNNFLLKIYFIISAGLLIVASTICIEFSINQTNELFLKNIEALASNENPVVYCNTKNVSQTYNETTTIPGDYFMTVKYLQEKTTSCNGKGSIKCQVGEITKTPVQVTYTPIDPSIPVSLK